MNLTSLLTTLALVSSTGGNCNAFSTVTNHQNVRNTINVALNAADYHEHDYNNNNNNNGVGVVGVVDSISRASFLSAAAMFLPASLITVGAPAAQAIGPSQLSGSSVISNNILLADAPGTALDFSLPSYDTKMTGFGEGTEAFVKRGKIKTSTDALMADPGSDEKEKEASSMRKAEEARKVALEQKKADQKERLEEDKRRAKEKKARDAERLKNIWSS